MKLDIIYNEDSLIGMKRLPNDSIDMMLTDPPYAEKYQSLWYPLGIESKRLLKIGGSFISLCGHYQLPFVLNVLSKSLRYWWICGMEHTGNLKRLPGKWVAIRWKPAVWFVKERRRLNDCNCPIDLYSGGTIRKAQNAKVAHIWGQPLDWFEHYIERLTKKGDIVLDPFIGSGTTAVACKRLNRHYIGFEINKEYCQIAEQRLEAEKTLWD